MPISKAERLMDLVIALLNAPRYRSASWVRDHVAGYDEAPSDDAFARMFERDKQELRDLGIPIDTGPDGDGYRIRPGEFTLPPLTFTAAESAALAVASRLWETTVLADAGSAALRKLRDAAELGEMPTQDRGTVDPTVQLRLRTSEPAFPVLLAALRSRRVTRFDYLAAGAAEPTARIVEPWGMTNFRGAWYLAGYDRSRGAARTFRLSRIRGEATATGRAGAVQIPADFDITAAVSAMRPERADGAALLRVRTGTADGLRRGATVLATSAADGYDDLRVPMTSLPDMARRVAAHGADALVLDPPELREAAIDLLRGAS